MRILWPLMIRRIVGHSMQPTLLPGTIVIGCRRRLQYVPRSVVIARMSGREVIKRVDSVQPDGVWLLGDNPVYSTDSRQGGLVRQSDILAVVVWPRTP